MKLILTTLISLCLSNFAYAQKSTINFAEYLKPKSDTLYYNCIYNSFHAAGLHDTLCLVYRKVPINNDTAYYISDENDTLGFWAYLASFAGSAMDFKNDSVLLASLTENKSPTTLTNKDFNHILSSKLNFSKPVELAKLQWSFVMKVFIKNYQFEDLSIGDTILKKCLRLNLLVYDRLIKPSKSTVWLSQEYGIVKWIRITNRVEVLDLKRFKKRTAANNALPPLGLDR